MRGAESFSEDHFGIIQANMFQWHHFEAHAERLESHHIRWPGGTLAEVDYDIYGLDIPNLFDGTKLWTHDENRQRPGLSDMLKYAIETDQAFSMIIPTMRYEDDLARGTREVRDFIQDLLDGKYGPLPPSLTLEIGNEYDNKFEEGAAGYAKVANALLEEIAKILPKYDLDKLGVDLKIGVQTGYRSEEDVVIRETLSDEALSIVNTVVHHALPIRFEAINQTERSLDGTFLDQTQTESRASFAEDWAQDIANAGGSNDVEHYMSAWNIGKGATHPENAFLDYNDYGLRSASASLELLVTSVDAGIDRAAAWGINAPNLNALSDIGGQDTLTHKGEAFRMMSEALPGATILDGYQANDRADAVMQYSFESDDTFVVFVAANDIQEGGGSVRLEFGDLADGSYLHVERLGTVLDDSYDGEFQSDETRVHEKPTVDTALYTGDISSFDLDLTEDYEFIRVVVSKGPPTDSFTSLLKDETLTDAVEVTNGDPVGRAYGGTELDDHMFGQGGDDLFRTGDGQDTVLAGEGDDTVYSGRGFDTVYTFGGNDKIYLGAGNDRAFGGMGDDEIRGDSGRDEIIAGQGNDYIHGGSGSDFVDGGSGNDRLIGGEGQDYLDGGQGNDRLTGGADSDVFRFDFNSGRDVITDFDENDVIILTTSAISNQNGDNNSTDSLDLDSLIIERNGNVIINLEGRNEVRINNSTKEDVLSQIDVVSADEVKFGKGKIGDELFFVCDGLKPSDDEIM
ncbi:calcium-binding protein [Aestuariibius insulae]|uniref:calcium-binding protein n=1 Tax=Aestuariibius insulae TaxID=2058287 RepID=UPI00398F2761